MFIVEHFDEMFIWCVYWYWWDVLYLTCIFNMYIIYLYYVSSYHVDVVVDWFIKCIMILVMINIINNLFIF